MPTPPARHRRRAPPMAVHVSGCDLAGGRARAIYRAQALRALADGVALARCASPTGTLAS
ncbi:DUF6233 domain-containing protein [Streptomyces flavidovirens]|uniref:DUF6233 domain-containing protein n=1 Tax=Streptomyces flavidovirens TaxID=67298 RepID=UPI003CC6CB50